MPNIKSSIKRVSVTRRKNLRNKMVKSSVRTAMRKFSTVLASDAGLAEKELSAVASTLDKAVAKGVMHKNTASRRKARMAKALSRAQA